MILTAVCTGAVAATGCEEATLGENGWEYKTVPCSNFDRPIPCVETVRNGKWLEMHEVACKPGEQKTVQQVEREEEAAMKKKCGKDFGQIRIGMALERFEDCTEAAAYVTDTVIAGGVVETYRSTFHLIHVKNGRIVGYTRRTN